MSVVHISLGRIVSQHSVDHDTNLTIGEPAVGSEPRFGLHGRRGHHKEASNADGEGDDAFDEEQPAPAAPAINATEVQEGKS